jgi:NAD(P)-dependent dehydrogenase (short-subunit alcohol dehydrogenase family)
MGEKLASQIAVVTGGSQGLGLAIAKRLLAEGASLELWDIDEASLAAAERELDAGVRVRTARVDVASEASVDTARDQALSHWGKVSILVNNAGVGGPIARLWDVSLVDWQRVIDINLTGVFLCCRAFVPSMLEADYGRIVNIASIAGKEASPTISPYASAKHGVIGLTKTLGRELATSGVTVNCVAPAVIETALTAAWPRDHVENLLSKIPMGRFGRPEELAALVVWIASSEASFNTGATFDLSGGRANY